MKRIISLLLACVLIALMAGCDSDSGKAAGPSNYTPDYYDAETFESDLNAGVKVNGKIVQFYVNDYKPDSILGINTWAGEHLNFLSEEELDVEKGDYVIGRITSEPTKTLLGGSWKIPYEVLEIRDEPIKNTGANTEAGQENETTAATQESKAPETTPPETTVPETTVPENTTIVMTADAASYAGKNPQDVEKEFKNLGFENIKLAESKTTDTSKPDGAVDSVTVASAGFSKGDSFEKDAAVVITYWKVEKPASEYEKAFVRAMSNYSLYYMFDTDNKTVVYFGTNDTYIEKGTYTGDFASGVTINWSHGEWTEKFTNKSGSNNATLIDGNGFDWEYKVCSVEEAQKILDGLK